MMDFFPELKWYQWLWFGPLLILGGIFFILCYSPYRWFRRNILGNKNVW